MTSCDCAQCCCVPLAEQAPVVSGGLALLGLVILVLVLGILVWLDDRKFGPPDPAKLGDPDRWQK